MPKAISALISRERSSIRCSISGALVASMSSWVMRPGLRSRRRRRVVVRACAAGSAPARASAWRRLAPSRSRLGARLGATASAGGAGGASAAGAGSRSARQASTRSHSLRSLNGSRPVSRLAGRLVDVLLDVGHLGLAHRLAELVLELATPCGGSCRSIGRPRAARRAIPSARSNDQRDHARSAAARSS